MSKKISQDSEHRMNTKTQIIIAIITVTGTIIVGYWQFGPKPIANEPRFVGRVVDIDTKTPVNDAEVTFENKDVPSVTRTDSKGIFSFRLDDHAREVRIRVQAAGYEGFDQRIVPASNTGIEDFRIQRLQKNPEPQPKNRGERNITNQNKPEVSTQAPTNEPGVSSTEQETMSSRQSSAPPTTKKMITIHLVIDNRLRNGDVFVDGKRVLSTPDTNIKTVEVVGFMDHDIIVATKTDTCRTSGYFDTENKSVSMNCN